MEILATFVASFLGSLAGYTLTHLRSTQKPRISEIGTGSMAKHYESPPTKHKVYRDKYIQGEEQ